MVTLPLSAARAKILKRLEIDVLNEPAIARPARNLKIRRSSERSQSEIHDHRASSAGIRRVAGNLISVVLEIARHDQLTLLGLGAIHSIARRTLRITPQRTEGLDILLLCGSEEPANRSHRVGRARLIA